MKIKLFLKDHIYEIIILIIGFVFGTFLMLSSFESTQTTILISSKSWSDFASHIPLIRSFSLGSNFPPEFPLFPGEHIKYHFIFYFIVGNLEKIGLPIGWALNIPSIIGFMFLIYMIFLLSKQVFKSKIVALMSVIFFLFNSSLSFIYFFKRYPISSTTISDIIKNPDFLSFAPYGDGIITAFWNLNIYTNQRHLALAFGLSLLIIYFVLKPVFTKQKVNYKIFITLGIILGMSFYFHLAALLMTAFVLSIFVIVFPKIRKSTILLLSIAIAISLPQYLYLTDAKGFSPVISFGYLTYIDFSLNKFLEFWVYNLGLSTVLIILGVIFSDKNQRKLFAAFFFIFIIGNTVQFSIEMAANHKFFNYFILVGNMFSAFALYTIWKKKNVFKPIVIILFFFMILGGIIDFFPLYNDRKIATSDYKNNPASTWIIENTPKDAVFLNTSYLFDPASLAGRKIYYGWPYFAWSQGYNTSQRDENFKQILGATQKDSACKLLKANNISYIEIKRQDPPDSNIPVISDIFEKEFSKKFELQAENYTIYDVNNSCASTK